MFRFLLKRGILLCLVSAVGPLQAVAQTARVRPEQAMFRQTADGRRLAGVMQGTNLAVGSRQSDWVEVTLEGWIWSRSVAATDRNGFSLIVSATGGENLRDEPGGTNLRKAVAGVPYAPGGIARTVDAGAANRLDAGIGSQPPRSRYGASSGRR